MYRRLHEAKFISIGLIKLNETIDLDFAPKSKEIDRTHFVFCEFDTLGVRQLDWQRFPFEFSLRQESELQFTVLSRLTSSRKRILLEFCLELKIKSVIKLNFNLGDCLGLGEVKKEIDYRHLDVKGRQPRLCFCCESTIGCDILFPAG